MNVSDSEILAGILEQNDYKEVKDYNLADVILVNTCSIRQKAEHKAYAFLHEVKKLKKKNPELVIGICGCVAEQEKERLVKKLPFVDLVMGPQGIDEFASLLRRIVERKETISFFGDSCLMRQVQPAKRAKIPRAYINIMYGCDNFCAYCIVPHVRGREICRPEKDVLKEIKELDKSLHKEVVLLGQNVNSWEGDKYKDLAELLHAVHDVEGVEWISFLTSHPKDMTVDIIDAVANLPKVNPYIHLPIQSGSSRILKKMNRKYNRSYYLRLVDKIYKRIPDVTLTSDIIVGFPGETDSDFAHSLQMVQKARFDSVITAAYSIRPETEAAKMKKQIPDSVKKERLQLLMKLVEDVAFDKNQKLLGRNLDVLVEGRAKNGKLAGRTRGSKIVYFEGPQELVHQIVPVDITSAKSWVLEGKI